MEKLNNKNTKKFGENPGEIDDVRFIGKDLNKDKETVYGKKPEIPKGEERKKATLTKEKARANLVKMGLKIDDVEDIKKEEKPEKETPVYADVDWNNEVVANLQELTQIDTIKEKQSRGEALSQLEVAYLRSENSENKIEEEKESKEKVVKTEKSDELKSFAIDLKTAKEMDEAHKNYVEAKKGGKDFKDAEEKYEKVKFDTYQHILNQERSRLLSEGKIGAEMDKAMLEYKAGKILPLIAAENNSSKKEVLSAEKKGIWGTCKEKWGELSKKEKIIYSTLMLAPVVVMTGGLSNIPLFATRLLFSPLIALPGQLIGSAQNWLLSKGVERYKKSGEKKLGEEIQKEQTLETFKELEKKQESHQKTIDRLNTGKNIANVATKIGVTMAASSAFSKFFGPSIQQTWNKLFGGPTHIPPDQSSLYDNTRVHGKPEGIPSHGEPMAPHGAPGKEAVLSPTEIHKGDNVWNIIKGKLQESGHLDNLNESQQTHLIDEIKRKVAADPKAFGISSGNADLLRTGDKVNIDINHIFDATKEKLTDAITRAHNLSPAEMASISNHNQIIAEWAKTHPHEALTTGKIEEILGHVKKAVTPGAETIAPTGTEEIIKSATPTPPKKWGMTSLSDEEYAKYGEPMTSGTSGAEATQSVPPAKKWGMTSLSQEEYAKYGEPMAEHPTTGTEKLSQEVIDALAHNKDKTNLLRNVIFSEKFDRVDNLIKLAKTETGLKQVIKNFSELGMAPKDQTFLARELKILTSPDSLSPEKDLSVTIIKNILRKVSETLKTVKK